MRTADKSWSGGHRCRRSEDGQPSSGGTRLFAEWLLVGLIALGLLLAYVSYARSADPELPATSEVLVDTGDTLWSLARANPVPGLSTSQTAVLIASVNGIDAASLRAGARLTVPANADRPAFEIASSE